MSLKDPNRDILVALGASRANAEKYAEHLRRACRFYDITTADRLAAFLATVMHETGRLKWLKELWGPTDAQRTYERDFSLPWQRYLNGRRFRNTKPYELGNIRRGDGFLFRGRGAIQCTGRANYRSLRDFLRQQIPDAPDFEADPDQLLLPYWAAFSAAAYWARNSLNTLADAGRFDDITQRVNGGQNGREDRIALYKKAKELLA